MGTLREELLAQQKISDNAVHTGEKISPEKRYFYKTQTDKYGDLHETMDYVSYDAKQDVFHIFCRGRAFDFSGEEFDWIFDYLRQIGTEIPVHAVKFMDEGNILEEREVMCGSKIRDFPSPEPTTTKVFETWCKDEDLEEVFDKQESIHEDTVLYARWINIEQ